jgi:ribonucleoside-diphosphate reductase alpha chain
MNPFRGIAISGCGLYGIYCLGACRYLQQNRELFNFEYYAGTSAGSIIASCMAMDIPIDHVISTAFEYFSTLQPLKLMQDSLLKLWKEFGVVDSETFFDTVLDLMGIPKGYTFEDVKKYHGKNLYINTFCVNTSQEIVYSYEKTPQKPIREAILESCTVPIIFTPRKSSTLNVDGVLSGYFTPCHLLDLVPNEILSVHIIKQYEDKSALVTSLTDYILRIFSVLTGKIHNHAHECNTSCLCIAPKMSGSSLFFGLFDNTFVKKYFREMLKHGFETAKTYSFCFKNSPSSPKEMKVVSSELSLSTMSSSKGFMQVQKRNGDLENVSFDKILRRIFKLADPSPEEKHLTPIWTNIDCCKVAQQVIQSLHDKIKTTELDTLAAETAIAYSTVHPDYAILAARIEVSNLQKCTANDVGTAIELLFARGLVNGHVMDMYNHNQKRVEETVDFTRDFLFDYFAIKTLCRSYLTKVGETIVERPQHMWMRVALGIHDDIDRAMETYEWMSQLYFTHATPTLFNAGTNRPQMSSCFLMNMEDSIDNIFKVISDCAQISKWCGGIGINVSNVRGKDARIKGTNGHSSGIVPMARVLNDTARYVNQGGKRLGSFALYLEPWHVDIFDFLDLKKNVGHEHERARDLFYAMWIPDLFMKRVKEQSSWSLFSPDEAPGLTECHGEEFERLFEKYEQEGKARKQVPAMEVWIKILESQIETGTPYMMYKDACNLKSNQSNLGTIQCSNLCVAPETMILTLDGYRRIDELEGKEVLVWNGKCWSNTTVVQTNENAELIAIEFSNGTWIECTRYHKFYRKDGTEVDAADLAAGDEMIHMTLSKEPVCGTHPFKYAYTSGLYTGYCIGQNESTDFEMPMDEDFFLKAAGRIDARSTIRDPSSRFRFIVRLPSDMNPKYSHPAGQTILEDKVKWLAGICDRIGRVESNTLVLGGIRKEFTHGLMLFLQELGVNSRILKFSNSQITNDGEYYNVVVDSSGFTRLRDLQLYNYTLLLNIEFGPEVITEEACVKVDKIIETGRRDKTYCFNEPMRHMGVFNGILCGNCSEIVQYTNVEKGEVAVCNLASICLPRFITDDLTFDFGKMRDIVKVVVRNINQVIDKNFYPVPETKISNLRHRPMGVGVQGLADLFAILGLPWESTEAKKLNQDIFEHMYFASIEESCDLASQFGPYESFQGSPASQGKLQYHLWGITPSTDLPWGELEERVKKVGLRNSLLLALMPTASTGQIMGNNECIEPFTSNIYLRRVLSGEFVVINKHLVRWLVKNGMWNEELKDNIIRNRGSIQSIRGIPDNVKAVYKTVWEIPQRVLIDMARDRGAFICQHQSLNLFVPNTRLNFNTLTAMHMHLWSCGNKGMYYLRTQSASMAVPVTLDPRKAEEPAGCESCSA